METGLYYVSSRYYDSKIGRFINVDAYISTGQGSIGHNMYAYCGNNSVNRVDIFGYCYYNANGVWSHDNWEYMGGYVRKPDPGYYQGTIDSGTGIYIADHLNYTIPLNGLRVLDLRDINIDPETGEHDPDIRIIDSYNISDEVEQKQILDIVDVYVSNHTSEHAWIRTRESLLVEWKVHNDVYWLGFARTKTVHVDFNNLDEGKKYLEFIWDGIMKN